MKEYRSVLFVSLLSSLVLASCGTMEFGSEMDKAHGRGKVIWEYTQAADHLTESQKNAMINRQPFVGMTKEEADMAMYYEKSNVYGSGRTVQAIYTGGWGVKYYLYFEGSPPRVVEWQSYQ